MASQSLSSMSAAQELVLGSGAGLDAVEEREQANAATKRQAMQRGRATRCGMRGNWEEAEERSRARRGVWGTQEKEQRQEEAAVTMQSVHRGRAARRGKQERIDTRDERRAATRIQARVRGKNGRQHAKQRAEVAQNEEEHAATAPGRLARVRGRNARREYDTRQAEIVAGVGEAKALAEAPIPAEDAAASNPSEDYPEQWAVFCKLDENGSGLLAEDEVWEFVAEKDEHVANELLSTLDTNNDGEIDFSEFLVVWKLLCPDKDPEEVVEVDTPVVASRRKGGVPTPTVSAPVSEPTQKRKIGPTEGTAWSKDIARDIARDEMERMHLAKPKEKAKTKPVPGVRSLMDKDDWAAFKRIVKPGKKLSLMEQILCKKIQEAERKAAKQAQAAAAKAAKGGGGGGGRHERRKQNRSPPPQEAEMARPAVVDAAAAARGPAGAARGRAPRSAAAAAVAGKPPRRPGAGARKEKSDGGDPVADVVRELVGGALIGAVYTVLQDTREKSAMRAVLSEPDVGARRHQQQQQVGPRGHVRHSAGGSGVKAVRVVRASESLPQIDDPATKQQRETNMTFAYGAVGARRNRRDRGRGKAGKQPGAVALPPLPPLAAVAVA